MPIFGTTGDIYRMMWEGGKSKVRTVWRDFVKNTYIPNRGGALRTSTLFDFWKWEQAMFASLSKEKRAYTVELSRDLVLEILDVIRDGRGVACDYRAQVINFRQEAVMEWRRTNGRLVIKELSFRVLCDLLYGERANAA
ncbi:MAG: hypothetical protein R3B71_01565 [Candidatus Gracilibacteria bacterium]